MKNKPLKQQVQFFQEELLGLQADEDEKQVPFSANLIIEGAVTAWKAYFSLSQLQEFN